MEKEKLCLRCMRKIGDNNVCPYCKNEKAGVQEAPFLPLKTVLVGKYLIGKLVFHNENSAVYYGFDLELKKAVTVYECFNRALLTRGADNYCLVNVGKASAFIDEKTAFLNKWNKIKALGEFSAIPEVYECFEDLGTAFAVGEYLGEMKPLREYLLGTEFGYLSWEEARVLLMPVLSALSGAHINRLLHLSVSPETIVIDANGKAKIVPAFFDDEAAENKESNTLFDGYSAFEQYREDGTCGQYTDVYSFAAVLYRTLIGTTPDSASERYANDRLMIPARFAEKMPAYVINGLINALQVLPGDRTATVEILRDELSASPAAVNSGDFYKKPSVPPMPKNTSSLPPPVRITDEEENGNGDENDGDKGDEVPDNEKIKKSTIVTFIISAVLCVAILISVVIILKKPGNGNKEETSNSSVSTTEEAESTENYTVQTTDNTVKSVAVPSFRGMNVDEILNNEEYKGLLTFDVERIDSGEKKDTVISQSISEGTIVNSLNGKKTVKLVVSDGLEVPEVVGKTISEARKILEKAGFDKVNAKMEKMATKSSEAYVVYRIVYTDSETGDWAAIPNTDRRISADDEIILSYCGDYVETTREETTEEEFFEPEENIDENFEDGIIDENF